MFALTPLINHCKEKKGLSLDKYEDMDLDQDVDPYYEVLKEKQRDYWKAEEHLC